MAAAYTRYVSLFLLLLLVLDTCRAYIGAQKDKQLLMDLCDSLIRDLSRKGQAVWMYRKMYAQYISFAMGERIYLIRARYAAMVRAYYRNLVYRRMYEVDKMVRNALFIQKRTQGIYILKDELIDFDRKISSVYNPRNVTRFVEPNCNVAGTCNMNPIRLGYRRTLGATDEALKLIEARRKFIKQTYHPKKKLPPINMDAEINRSLHFKYKYKYSTLSTPDIKTSNADFVNLAPDMV